MIFCAYCAIGCSHFQYIPHLFSCQLCGFPVILCDFLCNLPYFSLFKLRYLRTETKQKFSPVISSFASCAFPGEFCIIGSEVSIVQKRQRAIFTAAAVCSILFFISSILSESTDNSAKNALCPHFLQAYATFLYRRSFQAPLYQNEYWSPEDNSVPSNDCRTYSPAEA